ncbi:hypothetical protein D3C87_1964240 [compost metagenome]
MVDRLKRSKTPLPSAKAGASYEKMPRASSVWLNPPWYWSCSAGDQAVPVRLGA